MVVVYPRHIRAAGLCMSGARRWFPQYGMTFEACRRGEVTVEMLEATGDQFALQVAEIARQEVNDGRK
ncbi:MAG: hypothetical protein V7688_09550 [Alcanivorax jadensis]|jgi:hypothetical protein|uniref:hypothetical protein n=1 Tax=Alcanivorax jadensis TaxID=64988 RepID=UPI0025EA8888|nr:hypothetical protein [uncultured Alcanivorax sp.]